MKTLSITRSILFSALSLALFGAQADMLKATTTHSKLGGPLQKKTLNITVTNNTSINNFHYNIVSDDERNCDEHHNNIQKNHNNISNGNSATDKIDAYTPCKGGIKISIYVWDPVRKQDGDHVIDATNGGFPLEFTESPQHFGISYCNKNYGYCAGPAK